MVIIIFVLVTVLVRTGSAVRDPLKFHPGNILTLILS